MGCPGRGRILREFACAFSVVSLLLYLPCFAKIGHIWRNKKDRIYVDRSMITTETIIWKIIFHHSRPHCFSLSFKLTLSELTHTNLLIACAFRERHLSFPQQPKNFGYVWDTGRHDNKDSIFSKMWCVGSLMITICMACVDDVICNIFLSTSESHSWIIHCF